MNMTYRDTIKYTVSFKSTFFLILNIILVLVFSVVLDLKAQPPKTRPPAGVANKTTLSPKLKFPDDYSPLDKNRTMRVLTNELVESTIENSRQKYIKGLICIQRGDTLEGVRNFESAIEGLNKLVSYKEIENNSDFNELSQNILSDYEKYVSFVDLNNSDNTLNMFVSKQRLFETEVKIEPNEKIKPASATASIKKTSIPASDGKFIFKLPPNEEQMVPIVDNEAVQNQINFFLQGRGKPFIRPWLKRSSRWYKMILEVAKTEGMPEEFVLLPMIESAYNPLAVSNKSAVGLWQFMYLTGVDYGLNKRQSVWIDERRDPIKSTRAGLRYLRDMYLEFNDWHLTLAAYNWGWGNVRRAIKQVNTDKPTYWDIRTKKNIAMPVQAQNYVPLFLSLMKILSSPEEYGIDISDIDYEPEFSFDVIELRQAVNLSAVASAIGVGVEEIRNLNPELLYDITPPDRKFYKLRVPTGTSKFFIENYEKLPLAERQPYLMHTVVKGEDIISVSEKYDVAIDDFISVNNLTQKTITLTSGSNLRIPIGGKNYAQSTLTYTASGLQSKTEIANNNSNYHIVSTGESIYSVAAKYKISTANLRNWNNLPIDEELLTEGTTLVISAAESARQSISTKSSDRGASSGDNKSETSNSNSNKKVANTNTNTKNEIHVVKTGENLSKISIMYDIPIADIKRINNLETDNIKAGISLKLKEEDKPMASATTRPKKNSSQKNNTNNKETKEKQVVHTVKKGDNLSSIATKHGISIDEILKKNQGLKANKLQIGQKIKIK